MLRLSVILRCSRKLRDSSHADAVTSRKTGLGAWVPKSPKADHHKKKMYVCVYIYICVYIYMYIYIYIYIYI